MNNSNAMALTSPCYARETIEGTDSLREMGLKGKLNIRGDASNSAFTGAIVETLGLELPATANTFSEYQSRRLYWLGPDEWLLHCDLDETETLQASLENALADAHLAITDVSDYYTVLRLRGPNARALIRKGCPLDLHHESFPKGNVAQTRFGHASVLLRYRDDGETWDIQVRWSYAEYGWDYLVSGMASILGPFI